MSNEHLAGHIQLSAPRTRIVALVLLGILATPPSGAQPYRFGNVERVTIDSPHPYPDATGSKETEVVWSRTMTKPGSTALMVFFQRLELGPGDVLELVDGTGKTAVSYQGLHGSRWSPVIAGNTVTLILRADDRDSAFGAEVTMLAHRDVPEPKTLCENDHDDIQCYGGGVVNPCLDGPKFNTAQGVAHLRIVTETMQLFSCTGFLILAPGFENRLNLLITAGHCVDDAYGALPADPLSITAEFVEVYPTGVDGVGDTICDCHSTTPSPICAIAANPCDSPDAPGVPTIACRPGIVFNAVSWTADPNLDCDWGLIKLEDSPGAFFPRLPLAPEIVDETAYIVQHPQGRCKEIDGGDELDLAFFNIGFCTFDHCIDTESGSSGSPVALTSDDTIRGVHVLGGCALGMCPPNANAATRMSHILPELPAAVAIACDSVFEDGFESGDTSAWSSTSEDFRGLRLFVQ